MSGPASAAVGSSADDAGRYRLEEHLATGGMGEVWRATDTALGRPVAVKLLRPQFAGDPAFRRRFETEARHAASLQHPAIAAVFDVGERTGTEGPGSSTPYLVMELVEGQPLSALLRPDAPMDPAVAADLLAQAADGLGAAHAAGIVHRDVKPANLLITPDRRVKITDFGIARAASSAGLTETGQVLGTPQYLSPEQARGEPGTAASDVYSLGVVAFECLAGRRPFQADTPIATALAHLNQPVPDLPASVPGDLAAVVRRAMAKKPEERFADGAALAAALRSPGAVVGSVVGPADGAVSDDPASTGTAGAAGAAAAAGVGLGAGLAAGVGGAAAAAAPAEATQVLPPTGVAPPTPPPADPGTHAGAAPGTPPSTPVTPPGPAAPPPDRHSRWGAAALALLALAAVAAIVVLVLLTRGDDQTPTDTGRTPSRSARPTPTGPTASPTVETVTIASADYEGRDYREVSERLRSLGLEVVQNQIDNDGSHDAGTVIRVSPEGELATGSTVTVSYWGPAPTPSDSPTASPTPSPTPTPTPTSSPTPTAPATSGSAAPAPGSSPSSTAGPASPAPSAAPPGGSTR